MADHERDTLRTEVRAFRKVARWLSDPTAGRLADLMRIEEQINLTAMLPLVDVDLFAAVPDVGHRSASTTITGEVRIRPGDAGGPTRRPRQAHSVAPQDTSRPTAAPSSSEVPQQAPVFSLRQREASRDLRQDAAWPHAGSNRVPGQSLPPDVPAQAHDSQAHVSVQQSAGPEEARGDTSPYAGRSRSALAQLTQVAEELATHLHPHRAPDTAPQQRSVPEFPAPLRTPEPLALSQLEQLMHQALRLTSRASGTRMPREVPAERDVYDAQPGPWAALHAQDREASSVDTSGSPESDQQHVLHLIASHVDHLLASDMAAPLPGVRADIQPDLAGVRSLEHGAGHAPGYADHTSGASWTEAGAGFAGALPRPSTPANAFALREPPGAPQMDAASLAALVNEVLVEQARRHGVDLS